MMPLDIERFSILSPEAQQIVFDKKGLSTEAQKLIRDKFGLVDPFLDLPPSEIVERGAEEGRPIAARKFLEEVPETAGGIVGGIAGGLIGKSPTAVRVGAVAGAGVGGAIGKGVSQLLLGEELEPAEIAKAGGIQAGFEAGGRLVVGIAGKVLAPFRKKVTPEALMAKETLDRFMPKSKPSILPAEASENRTLDIIENISEASLFGGKSIADLKNITRKKAVDDMFDDLAKSFGERVEADQLGEAVEAVIGGRLKTARLPAQNLYNNVTELVASKGDFISTASLKKFARPLAERAKQLGGIGGANTGDDIITGVMNLPDNISYQTAQDLRSRLIAKADEFSVINKKAPAIGKARKLAGLTDESIDTAMKKENPEALSIWREANKIWRSTGEQFNNKFIRSLIKEAKDMNNPERIAEKLFKPRAISNIRKIRSAVDDDTFRQLKRWHVDSLLKKSVNTEGELIGNTLSNNMFGKSGMGEQTMRAIYTSQELNALKQSANALQVIQKRQAEGAGRMWIQLTQAGAFVGLLDDRSRPISMVILGGPAVLSRILTSKIGARWLIEGAKLPAKSPQAAAIIAKLGALALNIREDMEKKGEIPLTIESIQGLEGQTTLQ